MTKEKTKTQIKNNFEVTTNEQFVQGAVERFCRMYPKKRLPRYTEAEWSIKMEQKEKLLALPKPYVKADIDAITDGIFTQLQCNGCGQDTSILVTFSGTVHRCPICLNDAIEATVEVSLIGASKALKEKEDEVLMLSSGMRRIENTEVDDDADCF